MRITAFPFKVLVIVASVSTQALAAQILKTSGFSTCSNNPDVTIHKIDIQYNNENKTVTFDVSGTNNKAVNVTAILNVTAYGADIFIPTGTFAASGTQAIPEQYATLVPAIAFSVPDISAQARLELRSNGGDNVACITSQVTNGQTINVAAVSYASAGVAGAALVLTGATSLVSLMSAGGVTAGGGGTTSPGFMQVMTWFQGMAMNGMMSVSYPPIYRAFAKNFAFSTGIIPWTSLQTSIDSFRASTGGNLTQANVRFLQNATLVFNDGSTSANTKSILKRNLALFARQLTTSINSSTEAVPTPSSTPSDFQVRVSGIAAYIEDLSVPKENTFMTALLIIGIIIAAIVVGILLFKAILEIWALFGSFPSSLTGFRKHYWGTMSRSITQLILMLYGVVVLYSIFQFTQGDSWAAKTLAGVVLGLFTGVLVFFSWKIYMMAQRSKEEEGDAGMLYDEKEIWLKYSLFYESYKRDLWWTFVPAIVYALSKGCILAAADGHGLAQTIAQLVVEGLMLIFLVFARPYERKSGNVINIIIQVVRALSVICILVFVEELNIPQTTQTVTGLVLIVVQSVMTAVLAILILVNAIIICVKENPHRKRRKEAEKLNRDHDDLTPLHAHNSLLMVKTTSNTSSLDKDSKSGADTKIPLYREVEKPASGNTPFGHRGNLSQSSTSSNYSRESANPYRSTTTMPPAPIGAPYTPANSYRNVLNTGPPPQNQVFQPYRPNVSNGGYTGGGGTGGYNLSMARAMPPVQQRREMPGMLQMDGFGGYRGVHPQGGRI